MPVDSEYIEQLVLEHITGVISPEDSITLKNLLEQEPEAYAIWQKMHRQLTGSYMQSVREGLQDTLPLKQILETAGKRKRRKIFTRTVLGTAASLLVCSLVYKLLMPAFQPISPAPIPSFALKSVALQLPGGQLLHLGSGQQQEADGIIFREEGGKLSWSGEGNSSQLATLIVPPGKDYTVRLPDGTEVMLNAATILQMPLTFGDNREVTLNGEAWFGVAKNEQKPFRVHLPKSTVQVLGTTFNVNTYDSSHVKVALESGAVRMLTNDGDLLLEPGNAVHYQPGKKPVATTFDAGLFSWKDGYYVFEHTPISEIGDIIARTYRVKVVMDSRATANREYSSRLEKNAPLEQFLVRLKTLNNIDYQFENGDSVLHLLYRP